MMAVRYDHVVNLGGFLGLSPSRKPFLAMIGSVCCRVWSCIVDRCSRVCRAVEVVDRWLTLCALVQCWQWTRKNDRTVTILRESWLTATSTPTADRQYIYSICTFIILTYRWPSFITTVLCNNVHKLTLQCPWNLTLLCKQLCCGKLFLSYILNCPECNQLCC